MAAPTALVTGASGFVASHLVPALADAGWRVRCTGRSLRPAWMPPGVDYRTADLAEGADVGEMLEGVTHVLHLAGASSSRASEEEMHRSNVVVADRVMAAALGAGVERVLHMSSTSVYGEEEPLPQPVAETVEPRPSRGYGRAKWQAEQAVWRYAEKGLPVVVVRPVSIYGPRNTKLLASAILDAAVERHAGLRALEVRADPVELRLVHVDDLVGACLHLIVHDGAAGRAFNVTAPHYPASLEVAALIAAELGMEPAPADDPECGLGFERRKAEHGRMLAAGMAGEILLTPDRFRFLRKANRNNRLSIEALASTGFRHRVTDLRQGVASTIAWYRQHRWIV